MANALFDPARAVRFDLAKGVVLASSDDRVALVPITALDALARTAPQATVVTLGRAIGGALGQRVADRFGGAEGVRGAPHESVTSHLAGELAVAGLGTLSIERWGPAIVIFLERPALVSDALMAAIVSGALEASSGRALVCEPLGRERGSLRLLVAREATARRARASLASGVSWSDVVARLREPRGDDA
jgi:hypothetical protein